MLVVNERKITVHPAFRLTLRRWQQQGDVCDDTHEQSNPISLSERRRWNRETKYSLSFSRTRHCDCLYTTSFAYAESALVERTGRTVAIVIVIGAPAVTARAQQP
jgi:hypothetical protein